MDNNPILYKDPFGDKVEYNKLKDRVNVAVASITNKNFKADHKKMKAADETFIYKGEKSRTGQLDGKTSYDGNAVTISYQFGKTAPSSGESRFSNLFHEARHGGQILEGKIGFVKDKGSSSGDWNLMNHDAMDELEAFNAQMFNAKPAYSNEGTMTTTAAGEWKGSLSDEKKLNIITSRPEYQDKPKIQLTNHNNFKIDTPTMLAYPFKL